MCRSLKTLYNIGVWLSLVERLVRDQEAGGSNPLTPTKKKRQFSARRLSFLFVLLTFLFSFCSLLLNCHFRIKDKREKIKEKVALLRKALNFYSNMI